MTFTVLWRRLDTPGHDACRVARDPAGWTIEGTAVFRHADGAAHLTYHVACDAGWRARSAHVRGWLGAGGRELRVERTADGGWALNGRPVAGVADCLDVDLEFTPATNLAQLRRLALEIGQSADAPVAWLDPSTGQLERVPQHYARRSATSYWYESPTVGYAALLEVDPLGFVRRYPDLWEAER